jgi:hypothetical protein
MTLAAGLAPTGADVDAPREHDDRRGDRWWIAGAVIAGVLLAALQVREVISLGATYTDQDQTMLWSAGRAMLHGHVYEPNIWGSQYNTVFEGLPAAMAHVLGVSWGVAMPAATAGLALCAWVVLCVGAWRRGQRAAAVMALCAPLVMTARYSMLLDAPRGIMAGDLAAATGVAIALGARRREVQLVGVIGLGGLGVCWDFASLFLVGPAAVYLLWNERPCAWPPRGRSIAWFVGALAPAALWLVGSHLFYKANPTYLTAPSVSVVPHLSVLSHTVRHLTRYFTIYAPALWPVAPVAIMVLVALVVACVILGIRHRAWPMVVAAAVVATALLGALSLARATDISPGLLLGAPRVILPLPFGIWFLIFMLLESGGALSLRPSWRLGVMSVILALTVASAIVVQVRFGATATSVLAAERTPAAGITVVTPGSVVASCARIAEVDHRIHAQLFATERDNLAYGCWASEGLATIMPAYDRRGWVIDSAYETATTRLLVAGRSCSQLPEGLGTCTPVGPDLIAVITPPRAAAVTLGALGMPVRRSG